MLYIRSTAFIIVVTQKLVLQAVRKRLSKVYENPIAPSFYSIYISLDKSKKYGRGRGEEGQPQQFLVRATFSSFSRPSHL